MLFFMFLDYRAFDYRERRLGGFGCWVDMLSTWSRFSFKIVWDISLDLVYNGGGGVVYFVSFANLGETTLIKSLIAAPNVL